MEKLINLLLILWAAACVCRNEKTPEQEDEDKYEVVPRIGFGKTATEGRFPYQAIIYHNGLFTCGASIIHKRWLLTAAHCKASEDIANFSIKVGTIYRYGIDGETVNIEKFIQHEEYRLGNMVHVGSDIFLVHSNDIALIRLSNYISINGFVKPIKLARDDRNRYENVTAVVFGLGDTLCTVPIIAPEELQYAEVKVISDAECKKTWAELKKVTFRQTICTSVINRKGTCQGDSGGPLVYRDEQHQDKQIGIVSIGDPKNLGSVSDVYTRVSSFIPWIDRHLKSYSDVLP